MTSDYLSVAITAAELGGAVVRRHFRELRPDQIDEKARNDWVSVADRESEEAIASYLGRATPHCGLLAEERGASGRVELRWVVDPLDGTLNFVRGFPHFAVSVALVDPEGVQVGVVHDPLRDETYSARRGGGAHCNGVPIRASARRGLDGAFVTTGFPFRVQRYLDTYLAIFRDVFVRTAAIRRPGAAALDLAHTAAGIFDGFFEFNLSAWDIAAGALLVREAGGTVTNLDGGEEILEHGNVVSGGPEVHPALLEIVRAHCTESQIVP